MIGLKLIIIILGLLICLDLKDDNFSVKDWGLVYWAALFKICTRVYKNKILTCVYKNKVTKEEDSSLYKSLKEVCFFRLFILL